MAAAETTMPVEPVSITAGRGAPPRDRASLGGAVIGLPAGGALR